MKRLAIDMSSILWAGLKAGKDGEFGETVAVPDKPGKHAYVNGWQHGYYNALSSVLAALRRFNLAPRDILMVWDAGASTAFRRSVLPTYKAGRTKLAQEMVQFDLLCTHMEDFLRGMGATSVRCSGWEADDVLAHLAKYLTDAEQLVILTNDNDLSVLQGGNVTTYIGGEENHNKYGPWPVKYVTLYKALVGDSTDNVKGAHGFGEKAFLDFYCNFGDEGCDELIELIQDKRLHELDGDIFPPFRRILADVDAVYTSWKVVLLYPDMVNTGRRPFEVKVGMTRQLSETTEPGFEQWAGRTTLVHAGVWATELPQIISLLQTSPWIALDIETSAGDESDEWLEALRRNKGDEDSIGIDVHGHNLTGLSITLGDNGQHTYYFPVDHQEAGGQRNISSKSLAYLLQRIPEGTPVIIQNVAFELSVLLREWGELYADNGFEGMLPYALDTKLMARWINENTSAGLKKLSKHYLDYEQETYEQVTTMVGFPDALPPGGKVVETPEGALEPGQVKKRYRMNELTAQHVLSYGADDTICTAALFQWFRTAMALEGVWQAFLDVEVGASYLSARAYNQGQRWDIEKLCELEADDAVTLREAQVTLRDYLIKKGWEGTVTPSFDSSLSVADIKLAYSVVTGTELKTQVRTPSKTVPLIAMEGHDDLASAVAHALDGKPSLLNTMVSAHFDGEPQFNPDSPHQKCRLLYEVMGLPIRLRNKPTDKMRAEGKPGNAKADDLALQYALKYDVANDPELAQALRALQTLLVVNTKFKNYYRPYKNMPHWSDGMVRPQYSQSATITLRHACQMPNQQQMAKHEKHGEVPRIREVVLPHKRRAVVVSIDFSGQELRVLADESQDENMLACFVGDALKDMHSLTAAGIARRKDPAALWELIYGPGSMDAVRLDGECGELALKYGKLSSEWATMTYDTFDAARSDKSHPHHGMAKALRPLGKKTNFTVEYGAQAKKLAETLLIEVPEAQQYIDAKYAAFPRAEEWKREVIALAHEVGYATTKLGARRHLSEALSSRDGYERSKAERQAVNFKIQGSSAEMTKLAMGRAWGARLYDRFDAVFYGPVHDELVSSVSIDDAVEFIREKHRIMTMPYADMKVPIVASISLGRNWGEQIECGDDFDEAAIRAALAKCEEAEAVPMQY